jgi:nucleotide-binding universal stress UspA family protein
MFKNVIVGVDGRAGGRDAIALARRLYDGNGVLTLAYVYALEPRVWRGTSPAYDAAQREQAEELLTKTRDEIGVAANLHVVGSPSVGRGLHETAETLGADLLVVGSAGRGLLGRVFVVDDTRAALNGAPCAVAVTPAGYGPGPTGIREVGIGYDGSPESEHALQVARQLASEQHAELSAFEAVSLPAYAFVGPPIPDEEMFDELVERARKRVASIEGVTPHATYGVPAEELAVYSASLDLLVIGSRGYGPIGRLVHGSTALQLSRTARCPLLVLTRAARKETYSGASEEGLKRFHPSTATGA